MTRLALLRYLPVAALAVACVGHANAAAVLTLPTNLHFFTTSGPGPVNPAVLVGFNPQPDPPGDIAKADLTNPIDPSIDQPGFSSYTILFGMHGPGGDPFSFRVPDGGPNSDGFFSFLAFGDGSVFKVSFDISGFTGGWVGFNPQPDPPGDFANSFVGFGFAGDATLTWNVQEGTLDGDIFTSNGALSFAEVPEPAGLGMLGLGFIGLVALRRR